MAFPAATVVYRTQWRSAHGKRPGPVLLRRRWVGTLGPVSGASQAKAILGSFDITAASGMEQPLGPAPAVVYGQKGTQAAAARAQE